MPVFRGEFAVEIPDQAAGHPGMKLRLRLPVDVVSADRTFDMLMGSEVPPRRRFITTHASEVRNLDI